MEKHINIVSPRTLSLYGKTILINTLILSKASHLSNVFRINTDKANKINNKIWSNKPVEPIARKTKIRRSKPTRTQGPQLCHENKTPNGFKS